jgi:hypothetical protein
MELWWVQTSATLMEKPTVRLKEMLSVQLTVEQLVLRKERWLALPKGIQMVRPKERW